MESVKKVVETDELEQKLKCLEEYESPASRKARVIAEADAAAGVVPHHHAVHMDQIARPNNPLTTAQGHHHAPAKKLGAWMIYETLHTTK